MTTNGSKDWTDLDLEQYLLGELDAQSIKAIRDQAQRDLGLKGRIEEIQASNQAILTQYTPEYIAGQIRNKTNPSSVHTRVQKQPTWSMRLALVTPVVMLAVVVGVVLQPGPNKNNVSVIDGIPIERQKGDLLQLGAYRKTHSGQESLVDGTQVAAGDVIQLQYGIGEPGFGLIFSVDGNGVVTEHLSRQGDAVALKVSQSEMLDYAYELDDAPGFERFFFLFKQQSFSLSDLALEQIVEDLSLSPQADIAWPKGFRSVSLILRKKP